MAATIHKLDDKGSLEGTDTGTTTNAYADALDWDTRLLKGHKSIALKNTDGANGLKYKLLVFKNHAGQSEEEVAETTLAFGAAASFRYERAYARLKVQVKAAVADSQATYQIDWIGHS